MTDNEQKLRDEVAWLRTIIINASGGLEGGKAEEVLDYIRSAIEIAARWESEAVMLRTTLSELRRTFVLEGNWDEGSYADLLVKKALREEPESIDDLDPDDEIDLASIHTHPWTD